MNKAGLSTSTPVFVTALALLASCASEPETSTFRLSVVGTNDVHGVFVPEPDRGGIATISGYVDALRAARAEDGGSVLLIDAGDMWQGMLESNLNEGALMVEAYNVMDFAAAAIGNHEFDFGPVGEASTTTDETEDLRGALKQRAREMNFPLLSSNLRYESTGELIDWDNVTPSTIVDIQGVRVGIIGATAENTLTTTIASNVVGLQVETLVQALTREARALREQGADLVIVTAHSGSQCTEFDDPHDLSSCDTGGEIFRVAEALEPGLIDLMNGGHTSGPIAHFANGIVIISGVKQTQVFSRADFVIDRATGEVVDRIIYRPQEPCPWIDNNDGSCAWTGAADATRAEYENHEVVPNAAVQEIADRALAEAEELRTTKLGPTLQTPLTLEGNPESALGNLFLDAMLAGVDGDVSLLNVTGGIRTYMPAGEVTFGDVYEAFPFDNRIVVLELTGAELRRVVEVQAHNHRRRAGFSGVTIHVTCDDERMNISMKLDDGRTVNDDDMVRVITNDFLALGGDELLTPVAPEDGYQFDDRYPLMRDVIVEWFEAQPDTLDASQFRNGDSHTWNLPENLSSDCKL